MTSDKNTFWEGLYDTVQSAQNGGITIAYATVQSVVSGKAVLKFSGESASSSKSYKALKHYTPTAGERVMIINGVIIGGWTP